MAFSGAKISSSGAKTGTKSGTKTKRRTKGLKPKKSDASKPAQVVEDKAPKKPKYEILSRGDIPFGAKCYTIIGQMDGKNTKIKYCPFYGVAKFNDFYFPFCHYLRAGSISARFDVADMKKEELLDSCIELETNQSNILNLKKIWDYQKECEINEN